MYLLYILAGIATIYIKCDKYTEYSIIPYSVTLERALVTRARAAPLSLTVNPAVECALVTRVRAALERARVIRVRAAQRSIIEVLSDMTVIAARTRDKCKL
jgi:hypothetical protein